MHNADVVRMVRSGTSVSEVVARINSSDSGFQLYAEDVRSLRNRGVPEVVIHAMFVRQTGERLQLGDGASQQPPTLTSKPQDYLEKGLTELDLSVAGYVPHSSPSDAVGAVAIRAQEFVTARSAAGINVQAYFSNGGTQDVYLSGFYRHYQRVGSSPVYAFFGAGAGANVFRVSGVGANEYFLGQGEAGLRCFVSPVVAVDIGYNLWYLHINGLGFKDSSYSAIGIGFAYMF